MIKLWLDRAHFSPLEIDIETYENIKGSLDLDVTTLAPYLPTIRKLTLCLPFEIIKSILATYSSSSSTVLLEDLYLSFPFQDFSLSPDASSIIDAPHLHSFQVDSDFGRFEMYPSPTIPLRCYSSS